MSYVYSQAFLTVALSGFVWLTFILGLALAEGVTIYDNDWKVKEYIQDGTRTGSLLDFPEPIQ